jgi:hypothetical protein
MYVHGYVVDMEKGFRATRGNSERVFWSYEEASEFISEHKGYTLTYSVIIPQKEA